MCIRDRVYTALPDDWKMFVEYKAFEPNFYSTTVGDWGQSLLYASKLGNKAFTLVDLGHHLPNANIEQIVSLLLMEGKLGGFHFNDSKYCLLYTSPSPRDRQKSRMPSSA